MGIAFPFRISGKVAARFSLNAVQVAVTRSLMVRGEFSATQFCDWIVHRANVLSLSGCVSSPCEGLLEIRMTGNPVLLEAMETACSLGPLDAQVESIEVLKHEVVDTEQGFYQCS